MKRIGAISKKTKLPQVTWRLSGRIYEGRITEARGRPLVVALIVGDLVGVRPLGRRKMEYVDLATVYEVAYHSRVRSERMQKINFKKRRKR